MWRMMRKMMVQNQWKDVKKTKKKICCCCDLIAVVVADETVGIVAVVDVA